MGDMLETSVLQHLVNDHKYWDVVLPHMKKDYFESPAAQVIFEIIKGHSDEYNARANMDVIKISLSRGKYNENLWEQIKEVFVAIKDKPPEAINHEYLIEQTNKWMVDRACYLCIFEAVSIYEDKDRFVELSSIPERMNDALAVTLYNDLGTEYWENLAEFYETTHTEGFKIPFLSKTLNDITHGGAEIKSLNAVSAGINVGKTTCLISLAVEYMEQGYDVVYFSAEISEEKIRKRVDPRVTGLNFEVMHNYNKQEYISKIQSVRQSKPWGRMFIKELSFATMMDCRAYLKDLERRQGVRPKIIMFDYLTEFASYRLPISLIKNTDLYFGSVAREMRALMFEYEAIGWTATQLQRSHQNTIEAGLDNVSDSITIPKVLDFMMMVSVPDEFEGMNLAHCSIQKSRYGNKPHFHMKLDQETQILSDPDGGVTIMNSLNEAKEKLALVGAVSNGENYEEEKAPRQELNRVKKALDSGALASLKT